MNSVWYKFRSATTWRELQIPSTFITIGEMRQLICKELHLQEQETVLLSENGDDKYRPLADEKQFPRGSRFWAARTTFDHIRREKEQEKEVQAPVQDSAPVQEDSDDDFGPDLFDRDAQLKYEERERLEAIADQYKLEQELKAEQAEEHAWDSNGEATEKDVKAEPAKLDPKRASMRLIEDPDDVEIDWARLIEERKTNKAAYVKQEVKEEPSQAPAAVDNDNNDCTTVATASQAVAAAATEPELQLDAQKRVSSPPPEQPAVPSLLETCPSLLNVCDHILPDAPLEHLYLAFPNTRPRKRADWESFQKHLKERTAAAAERPTKPAKPPGTPPSNSQRSSSVPPRPDISPAESPPPSPGGKRWEPSPQPRGADSASHQHPAHWDERQRQRNDDPDRSSRPPRPPFHHHDAHPSNSGAARSPRSHSRSMRSPSPAHWRPQPHSSRSPAPTGRHRSSQPRSRSPAGAARAARDRSGSYERFRSRSPARMHGAHAPRDRSRRQQDLRYASDSYRYQYCSKQSPSANGAPASRGGMRGGSDRAGAAEPSRSDAERMNHMHERSRSRSPQRTARHQAQYRASSSSDSSDSSSSSSQARSQSPPRAHSSAKHPASRGKRMSSRSASPQEERSHAPSKSKGTAAPITERVRRSNARQRSQTPPSVSKGASQGSLDEQASPQTRSSNRKKQGGRDRGALARRALGGLFR